MVQNELVFVVGLYGQQGYALEGNNFKTRQFQILREYNKLSIKNIYNEYAIEELDSN